MWMIKLVYSSDVARIFVEKIVFGSKTLAILNIYLVWVNFFSKGHPSTPLP